MIEGKKDNKIMLGSILDLKVPLHRKTFQAMIQLEIQSVETWVDKIMMVALKASLKFHIKTNKVSEKT